MNRSIDAVKQESGDSGKGRLAFPLGLSSATVKRPVRFLLLAATVLFVAAAGHPAIAQRRSPRQVKIPKNAVELSYVDNSSEGKMSIAGSGHAVEFQRPEGAKSVVAVQIFGSRYGYPQPPREDFHVYLLDQKQKVIDDLKYPYATVEWGQQRWYTLPVPKAAVPERFFVALSFNPEQRKGVYLGIDKNVEKSHSYTGLPHRGFQAYGDGDWMIRVYLVAGGGGGGGSGSGGFAAVVELEFPAQSPSGISFVDLEAGKVVPVAAELKGNRDRKKWMSWSEENGVDASVRIKGQACYLGYIDACVLATANSRWESQTAALLARNRTLQEGEPGLGNFTLQKADMPATYLFKTREGSLGLVQVVGFTDKLESVKIRFKLVQ